MYLTVRFTSWNVSIIIPIGCEALWSLLLWRVSRNSTNDLYIACMRVSDRRRNIGRVEISVLLWSLGARLICCQEGFAKLYDPSTSVQLNDIISATYPLSNRIWIVYDILIAQLAGLGDVFGYHTLYRIVHHDRWVGWSALFAGSAHWIGSWQVIGIMLVILQLLARNWAHLKWCLHFENIKNLFLANRPMFCPDEPCVPELTTSQLCSAGMHLVILHLYIFT